MPELYVLDGLLLCRTHAMRHSSRDMRIFSGPRRASRTEVSELGGSCEDCALHGPPIVRAIRVGGEAFCVEDSDGELKEEIVVSEQCETCGSTREDGSQAPFVLDETGPVAKYRCERCGVIHRIAHTSDLETVF